MIYKGTEQFTVKGQSLPLTITDFWRWAYSDLTNNIGRSVLAEYIVASALDIVDLETEQTRIMWRPFDLLSKDGYRIEVKSAAYVQSWDAKHPDHITFRIAPARTPDATGDYKLDAPLQRNSDVYVFCIYKAMSKDISPLNLDLWDFYVLPTKILDDKMPTQKTVSFPVLKKLEPTKCDFYGLRETIKKITNA